MKEDELSDKIGPQQLTGNDTESWVMGFLSRQVFWTVLVSRYKTNGKTKTETVVIRTKTRTVKIFGDETVRDSLPCL